jgi:pimeloyl-ACP methyl ester carboxylesterase
MQYYPIVLVRGFDPLGGANRDPFNGFNDATAYLDAVYSSRDFEGFILSFLNDKTHPYTSTLNVLRFHEPQEKLHPEFDFREYGLDFTDCCFSRADPQAMDSLKELADKARTFWVFNFYAAYQGNIWRRRHFKTIPYFARELQRFIAVVKAMTGASQVNLVAHSMGGVVVRHLIQRRYGSKATAQQHINRIATLGSPLTGITYLDHGFIDLLRSGVSLGRSSELDAMDPDHMRQPIEYAVKDGLADSLATEEEGDINSDYGFASHAASSKGDRERSIYSLTVQDSSGTKVNYWDPARWLCVIGTREEGYAAGLGRTGSLLRDNGRSDGLVAQDHAWLEGCPRAYLHKIHGGPDSLITSRDSFEVVTRYLFGTHDIEIALEPGSQLLNFDRDSQYFVGLSVKVRAVDFFLHQMDRQSRNCIDLYRPSWVNNTQASGRPQNLVRQVAGQERAELLKELVVYQGALDMQRSFNQAQLAFRVDLNIYAEDEPSLRDKLRFLNMRHSDLNPVAEQFVALYQPYQDQEKLLWFRDSKELMHAVRDIEAKPTKALTAATAAVDSTDLHKALAENIPNVGTLRSKYGHDIEKDQRRKCHSVRVPIKTGNFDGHLTIRIWKR